jgi:AraC family transcriptional regulator
MSPHFASLRVGRHAANSAMAPHRHDRPSLCILIGGEYEERIRGRSDGHRPGSLSFCPADEPHSQQIGRSGASKLVLEPTATGLDFLAAHARLDEAPVIQSRAAASIGRRMVAELSVGDDFSAIALEGLGHELLATFGRSQVQDVPARWLQGARDYLAAHACDPVGVREIAAAIDCDPIRLSRGFRRAFGHTIGQHQRRLRVAAAAELLSRDRMPLAEVAQACGFYDQSHLTRTFKAEIGCTPAAYRRRA